MDWSRPCILLDGEGRVRDVQVGVPSDDLSGDKDGTPGHFRGSF